MRKSLLSLLCFVSICSTGGHYTYAQTTAFSENAGVPIGTLAFASYSGWQNNATCIYSDGGQPNPADVRNTTPSGSYTGASGNGNVFFSANNGSYGFSIEGIDVSTYTNLSLKFGYRKETVSAHAGFAVDFWNGSNWVSLANTAAALFNESSTAATGWYLSKTLNLPPAAQISNLKLRFVKSGIRSIRIDDIVLSGINTAPPVVTSSAALTFGSICLGESSAPQLTTLSGSNLDGTDIIIGPLGGYSFCFTAGGSYTSTLLISGYGGNTLANTDVYVRFSPPAVASYDGSIPITGGGTSNDTIAVTGSGVNTTATIQTDIASQVSPVTATCHGTITATGCGSITARGIEFSSGNGFTNGTGVQVSAGNISSGTFSSVLSGLAPGATYYFKAYAVNNGGISYGSQQSFQTLPLPAPISNSPTQLSYNSFVASWSVVSGAQGYRLDVSSSPQFGATLAGYTALPVGDTFQVVTGLDADETYYYRVRAYASGSTSVNSDTESVVTWKDPNKALYQTKSSGQYSDISTWEYNYTGSDFADAVQVPGANNEIIIFSQHQVELDSDVHAAGMILNGKLDDNGYKLMIRRDLSGGGIHSSTGDGGIIMKANGSAALIAGTANDTLTLDNLELNGINGFEVSGHVHLKGVLKLSLGQLNTGNGDLSLLSAEDRTARVAPITGGSITGPVTVERFLPAKRAWRFLTAPVNTTSTILDTWQEGGAMPPGYGTFIMGNASDAVSGLDLNPSGQRSLFTFDGAAQSWLPVTNTITDKLIAGQGYRIFIRGDRTQPLNPNPLPVPNETRLRAKGQLITGTVSFGGGANISNPPSLPSLAGTPGQFSLIGNPYASPVDWESLISNTNTTGINPNYYWVWDACINGSNGRGGYVVYETGTASISPSEVNRYIQPGQAVFIQTTASDPRIEFREEDKAGEDTKVFKTTSGNSRVVTRLFLDDTLFADAAVVKFDNSYSDMVGYEDALKLPNLDENLGIARDTISLSVDARPEIALADTIQFVMEQLGSVNYTLKCSVQELPAGMQGYLIDRYFNEDIPLDMNGETAVSFSINSDSGSYAPNRFFMVFSNASILQLNHIALMAEAVDGKVNLTCINEHEMLVREYQFERSADGSKYENIATMQAKGNDHKKESYSYLDPGPETGDNYYRVTLTKVNGDAAVSETLKVNILKEEFDIDVYPNPLTEPELTVKVKELNKGIYTLRLLDGGGMLVYMDHIDHAGGSGFLKVLLPRSLSNGSYVIHLSGGDLDYKQSILIDLNRFK